MEATSTPSDLGVGYSWAGKEFSQILNNRAPHRGKGLQPREERWLACRRSGDWGASKPQVEYKCTQSSQANLGESTWWGRGQGSVLGHHRSISQGGLWERVSCKPLSTCKGIKANQEQYLSNRNFLPTCNRQTTLMASMIPGPLNVGKTVPCPQEYLFMIPSPWMWARLCLASNQENMAKVKEFCKCD